MTTHDHAQSVAPHTHTHTHTHTQKKNPRPCMNYYALILLAAHAKYGSSVWKEN